MAFLYNFLNRFMETLPNNGWVLFEIRDGEIHTHRPYHTWRLH